MKPFVDIHEEGIYLFHPCEVGGGNFLGYLRKLC